LARLETNLERGNWPSREAIEMALQTGLNNAGDPNSFKPALLKTTQEPTAGVLR
jgi:hypothetical protein